jgi:hypothetical protein
MHVYSMVEIGKPQVGGHNSAESCQLHSFLQPDTVVSRSYFVNPSELLRYFYYK